MADVISEQLNMVIQRLDAMDAKFESKIDALDAKIDRKIDGLRGELNKNIIDTTEQIIGTIQGEIDRNQTRFERVDAQLGRIEGDARDIKVTLTEHTRMIDRHTVQIAHLEARAG